MDAYFYSYPNDYATFEIGLVLVMGVDWDLSDPNYQDFAYETNGVVRRL